MYFAILPSLYIKEEGGGDVFIFLSVEFLTEIVVL